MKSRTYTGWAVQLDFASRPTVLESVLHFGAAVPNFAVVQHAVFETKKAAGMATAKLRLDAPFIAKPVKVKIKFEVIE